MSMEWKLVNLLFQAARGDNSGTGGNRQAEEAADEEAADQFGNGA